MTPTTTLGSQLSASPAYWEFWPGVFAACEREKKKKKRRAKDARSRGIANITGSLQLHPFSLNTPFKQPRSHSHRLGLMVNCESERECPEPEKKAGTFLDLQENVSSKCLIDLISCSPAPTAPLAQGVRGAVGWRSSLSPVLDRSQPGCAKPVEEAWPTPVGASHKTVRPSLCSKREWENLGRRIIRR